MTITSEKAKEHYSGNGATTIFDYDFKINLDADIVVTVADSNDVATVLTLNTHYTVAGAGVSSGGSITLLDLTAICEAAELPTGWTVTIVRDIALTQETDLSAQGGFSEQTHEDVFDYLTMLIQMLSERVDRAVKVSVTSGLDGEDFTDDLDNSVAAALAAQAAAETAETNAEASETAAALSETNAATSETNAATSETNAGLSEVAAAASAAAASGVVAIEYSENITSGDLLKIINDSGAKVKKIVGVASSVIGTAETFLSGLGSYSKCCYDSVNNKVIVVYRDDSNAAGQGEAVVGTISGQTVTFGTPVAFATTDTNNISCCYDSTNGRVVIAYRNNDSLNSGYAVVGTVSGASITFGTQVKFEDGATTNTSCCFDSLNDRVVIAYTDVDDSSNGKAIVGTVSDTSISFGTEVDFSTGTTVEKACTFDVSSGKVVVSFRDQLDSNKGKAIVGTVSGTSISFGTEVDFESSAISGIDSCYDSSNGNVIIAYDVGTGKAISGAVSGTNITFGTASEFWDAALAYVSCCYDPDKRKVIIAFQESSPYHGKIMIGSIIGDALTFSEEATTFKAVNSVIHIAICYDTEAGKALVVYYDNPGSVSQGVVVEYDSPEYFFGVAQETGVLGDTKNVAMIGDTSEIHTGKTPGDTAYIQTDGSLGEVITAYPIGRFISATGLRLTKNP